MSRDTSFSAGGNQARVSSAHRQHAGCLGVPLNQTGAVMKRSIM
jgi:hypothetical protein